MFEKSWKNMKNVQSVIPDMKTSLTTWSVSQDNLPGSVHSVLLLVNKDSPLRLDRHAAPQVTPHHLVT